MKNLKIRDLILETEPPFEWNTKDHPIQKLGHFFFGIADGFSFDKKKVYKAEEEHLWKLYALINKYWLEKYQEWNKRTENMVFNMRNNIEIKKEDVGKNLLDVYEAKYDWGNGSIDEAPTQSPIIKGMSKTIERGFDNGGEEGFN